MTKQEPVYKIYDTPEDKMRVYEARVRAAEDELNERKPKIERRIARYRGEYVTEYTHQGHMVNVPTGTGNIDAMYSSLTAIDVGVAIEPAGLASRIQARLAEKGIGEVFREQKVSHKAGYVIKDALLAGIGWMKIGYDYFDQEIEKPRSDEDIAKDVDAIFEAAEESDLPVPDPEQVAAVVPTKEKVLEVVRDRIVADYVPWDEMLWDPTARKSEDIRWIGQRWRFPVYEVRNNPHFEDYCREHGTLQKLKELTGDSTLDLDNDSRIDLAKDGEESEYITGYEIYDFETGLICTFAKGTDFLLNEQENPLHIHEDLEDKSPYVALVLREDPMSVWGISDMELMENSLDELNVARTNLLDYLDRFVGKVLGPAEALGEQAQRAMKSREWGEYVGLDAASANDIKVLDPPALPQEMFDLPGRITNDIRESTGVNELMRGIFPDRKRTATETNEVVAASSARQSEKRNRLEKFYVDIAKRILFYMQLFYDAPRIARLADVDGDVEWQYTAEDIVMEADLVVHLQPKEAITAESRQERALMLLNTLGPLEEVDRKQLIKVVLEDMGFNDATIQQLTKQDAEIEAEQAEAVQQEADMAAASQGVDPVTGAPVGMPAESIDMMGLAGAAPTSGEGDLAFQSENTVTLNE